MSTTTLSLYSIETEILNLMILRESLVENDEDLSDAEQKEALKKVDIQIREKLSSDLRANKVDGVAYYLREFAARAEAANKEVSRLQNRKRMWEDRGERLEKYVKDVMQLTGQSRLEGNANTLKLVKNPPSVEIAQPELVPEEYRMVEVRMPLDIWRVLQSHLYTENIDAGPLSVKPSVSKSKIGEALKQTEPCTVCGGIGVIEVYAGHGEKRDEDCKACNRTGKVKRGVPGCVLVTDRVSLRVE